MRIWDVGGVNEEAGHHPKSAQDPASKAPGEGKHQYMTEAGPALVVPIPDPRQGASFVG